MKANISLNMAYCKGCGICAAFCPKNVLAMGDDGKVAAVTPENCIGCKNCEYHCPDFAIRVQEVLK